MGRSRYDTVTGTSLGLYQTLGCLCVQGDPNEHFLDYGFCKKNSKILYSHHKRRIPSSFSGTFFNSQKVQFESGGYETTFSKAFYFLPSTTDRSEKSDRHLGSVNLSPIYIHENTFKTENKVPFDPSKLDIDCTEKEVMAQAVPGMLRKNNKFIKFKFDKEC